MRLRRITRYSLLLFAIVGIATIAWSIAAGPATVYRTLVYNFSGIDDYRIFPQRRMSAAPQPFRFREAGSMDAAKIRVSAGSHRNVLLADLLTATDTVAFLVVKHDALVVESYLEGFDRATRSLSFSMAKSFLSMLIGCAIAEAYLKSVDQPVTDFVPELRPRGFDTVTLKHLLQMTSGMDYVESNFPFGLHVRFYYTDRLERRPLMLY